MMAASIHNTASALAAKDANVSVNNVASRTQLSEGSKEGSSLEYHRQVLKSKMEADT